MNQKFALEDIIVCEGVITKFGVIKILVNTEDPSVDIRRANSEEIERYYARPEKSTM